MPSRPTSKTATYLLRLTPGEKAHLEEMARLSGTTLADALRVGAHDYLRQQVVRVVPTEGGEQRAFAT